MLFRSEVDAGSDSPHKHKLIFWIVPKKGVVKREFEYGMAREPMPAKEPES